MLGRALALCLGHLAWILALSALVPGSPRAMPGPVRPWAIQSERSAGCSSLLPGAGKFGALLATIPQAIIAGLFCVMFGLIVGVRMLLERAWLSIRGPANPA